MRKRMPLAVCMLLAVSGGCLLILSGCYRLRTSSGGGQTSFQPPRLIRVADIAVPAGYRIEPVATGLTFPSGVAFDDIGRVYVIEAGYSYGEVWTTPRLLRIDPDRQPTVIATGGRNGPWNGVTFHQGTFYVAEGGELEGGRILRIDLNGTITPMVEGLPSLGDHHTNGPIIGPDGALYFGQGTATNSAVVGEDNAKFGWLSRHPSFHDIPCQDITLTGQNFASPNVLKPESQARVMTGAFSALGTPTTPGQVIRGQVPCSGAIFRMALTGGPLELVAWGLRNPFGLAFAPDGRLYVVENGYDDRGSRPVWGAADHLWVVTPGTWYGWPDFSGHLPLTQEDFKPPGKSPLAFVLATHPNPPPQPVAVLGAHSSSNGLDFSYNPAFGYVEQAFVAQFGDMAPTVGKILRPVGFKVVRVDVTTGVIEDFAVNKGHTNGPASWVGSGGLERPIAARFDPRGSALYIVDFGVMTVTSQGPVPQQSTGVLWRIWREGRS
jgi:glucose/arabinose dehydrogenase